MSDTVGWSRPDKSDWNALTELTNGRSTLLFYARSGWCAMTPHGVIWEVFGDERQHDADAVADAAAIIERVEATGQPPRGCWS